MYWFWLIVAIGFEVTGTTFMKLSEGFSKLLPSIAMFIFYAASLASLTMALRKIEVGTAYAIWSGIGTAAIAIIGIFLFSESVSALKIISIFLIVLGVIGLNLAGSHS